MSEETLPRSMLRDLEALERAAAEFDRVHGDDARRRWAELGARTDGELAELQLAVVERDASPAVWDALAWEVSCRIELLESARQELARERSE